MSKYTLIKLTEGYIIVSDENKKENDYVYHPGVSKKYTAVDITKKGNDRYTERNYIAQGIYKHIPTTNDWYLKERKIIASTFIPELPNIDFNNLEEEFGIVDMDKIIDDEFSKTYPLNPDSYRRGFNKCLEINKDKLYTEEDIKNAIKWLTKNYSKVEDELAHPLETNRVELPDNFFENVYEEALNRAIQSLQPKTEWDVDIETYSCPEKPGVCALGCVGKCNPKIENNSIKIIKILK